MLALLPGAARAGAGPPPFDAHGSVEQVYVTGLRSGVGVSLFDRKGREVRTRRADELGGVLFRKLAPGKGYRVGLGSKGPQSGPLRVLSTRSAPLSTAVYDQAIPSSGYGYLTTRDGTRLAIDVHSPDEVAHKVPGIELPPTAGPTPTLIEYSGYGYADPAGPQSGLALIANLMGFTVVDVNMRGTGCSGGAFDFFEPLQSLDGYDVVETIARQPWVANHKVGLMGISYGGISQLFTAATRPPSLAAITPLSVLDSPQTTLYPGGLLNTGFAVPWAEERVRDAKPASATEGQAWAYKRIQEGDRTCASNQALHGEAVNLLASIKANRHYRPRVADPLSPITFVDKIDVPTFMACQWTDEQTGGHCPDLAEHFSGTPRKWFTFTNGTHIDALDPATFNRWFDFLELFVAGEAPISRSATVRAAAPLIYQEAMGIPGGATLPPDPVQLQPTYAGALAAFESLPPVRILFDNGAGGSTPGKPYAGFEQSFGEFPIPGTEARAWYLAPQGRLRDRPPVGAHADGFTWNAQALPMTDFSGDTGSGSGGLWTPLPKYEWAQNPPGQRGLLPLGAAGAEHDRDRRRRRAALGPLLERQRRPAGDDQRGPARRPRDLRPERLGAGQRAQARRQEEHAAGAGAEPPQVRCLALPARSLRQGHGPALLRGPRLPRRLADPGDDRRARRLTADLGLCQGAAEADREGRDRLLRGDALEAPPPGRPRGRGADRAAALSGPAGRAVPCLPGLREPGRQALTAAPDPGPRPAAAGASLGLRR